MSRPHPYKVQLGEQLADLVIEGEELSIDGDKQNFIVDRLDDKTYNVVFNNKSYRLFIESTDKNKCTVFVNGRSHEIIVKNERDQLLDQYGIADVQHSVEREIHAPMPGLVLDVLVTAGDVVEAGNGLIVLEAMKMENELKSPSAGRVASIHVNPGDPVAKGELLIELEDQ